jgi:hypothetical protein
MQRKEETKMRRRSKMQVHGNTAERRVNILRERRKNGYERCECEVIRQQSQVSKKAALTLTLMAMKDVSAW